MSMKNDFGCSSLFLDLTSEGVIKSQEEKIQNTGMTYFWNAIGYLKTYSLSPEVVVVFDGLGSDFSIWTPYGM